MGLVLLGAGCGSSEPENNDARVGDAPKGTDGQAVVCGNGVVEAAERCDTKIADDKPGACPKSCDDGNVCTKDELFDGDTCDARCEHTPITACVKGDGCCPAGCDANNDDDCSPTCGNGSVEAPEKCDTKIADGTVGACPKDCEDENACTKDTLLNGGTCGAICQNSPITACANGDGCCPSGCNANNDDDCSASCGNGAVEGTEKCDTAITAGQPGACPQSCDDQNACTADTLLNGGTCGAVCQNSPISTCKNGDGCCPTGCNANNDDDCSPSCGNRTVEGTEKCDTAIVAGDPGACPTDCNDNNTCTRDALLNGGTCGATCANNAISQCTNGDGCCPSGCNAVNDNDCSATCGNGVVEGSEQCDTGIVSGAGACPTGCDDGNTCTADTLLNGGTCGATCSNQPITQCTNGDGCCPTGCNAVNDNDCSATCGNGVVEGSEQCDTGITSGVGACPTRCDDGNSCTRDVLLNAGTCGAVCSSTQITQCTGGDGCCPAGCNNNNDSDCSASCGNGVVEGSEQCDTGISSGPGSCPTACDDGQACTTDTLLNGGTCGAQCRFAAITQCRNNDGCCPTGCNAVNDNDCSPTCGNGVVEGSEQCDTAIAAGQPGACPTSCSDGSSCTTDALLNGGTCGAQCSFTPITSCANDDGCCPAGCNATNDNNCSASCGNGVVEPPETCDTTIAAGQPGACPQTCSDGNACTTDTLLNGGTCAAQCTFSAITQCRDNDNCCPTGCNNNNDNDCSPSCGNGVVEGTEQCDTAIAAGQPGACPTSCSDGSSCTRDVLLNAGTCGAQCSFPPITSCADGDGCCPTGCNATTDNDCSPSCGNGVVEPPELCDTAIAAGQPGACPTSCSDGQACTSDTLLNAGTCGAQCSFTPITSCTNGDGCCPSGCNALNDDDCSPTCGNGVVETPERCDTAIAAGQPGACPTSCSDGQACTQDALLNGGTCGAQCSFTPITSCTNGDGCCPTGCNAVSDSDCSPSCGNGVVEPPETCDTAIAAGQPGACPTSCSDGNSCTQDTLLNGGTCGAQCTFTNITSCTGGDGCCPSGCNAVNDSDCSPSCGNGVVETPERCDTGIAAGQPGACPTSCSDGQACTTDTLQNGGTCAAQCSFTPITACTDSDGCCPTGCNALSDNDCSPTCGNGVVEPPETCDTAIAVGQPGACPRSCSDGQACTADALLNAGTCGAQCSFTPITACANGDGCCPTGCNALTDGDCSASCGNGVVEPPERCDTAIAAGQPGACPTACSDGNACTQDTLLNGGTCDAQCSFTNITSCADGDGCCPTGCNAISDSDCSPSCGNGVVEPPERCDTAIAVGQPGACPTSCSDGNDCTTDTLQNGGTCSALCSFTPITACTDNDGCCPTGCNNNNDNDCSPSCGNGVVETGEQCDTAIPVGQPGTCPLTCSDGDDCTSDVLLNAGTCAAQCSFPAVTQCRDSDGCCPVGCDNNNDNDCMVTATCGNGIVEPGELCDTGITGGPGACPVNCDDGQLCTTDTLLGAGTCQARCQFQQITQCIAGDRCCPSGCTAATDGDCQPQT
ncbi:MAG: hypothetical protein KC503_19440 [Myxococcales bacterium]|nr:hypothetical protein [Myxococcales bacterium]